MFRNFPESSTHLLIIVGMLAIFALFLGLYWLIYVRKPKQKPQSIEDALDEGDWAFVKDDSPGSLPTSKPVNAVFRDRLTRNVAHVFIQPPFVGRIVIRRNVAGEKYVVSRGPLELPEEIPDRVHSTEVFGDRGSGTSR